MTLRAVKPHKSFTKWPVADKERAVMIYKSLNYNLSKTAEVSGIPYDTLFVWQREDWWGEKLNQLSAQDTAELGEAATNIAKRAVEVVQDRLEHGDHVLNRDGNVVRRPVSAKDAAIIAAVAIDKRKILAEEPVRQLQLGTAERLLKLVEQFSKFANSKEARKIIEQKTIEGEFEEILDAEQNTKASTNDGSSSPQSEVREGSGDSGEGSQGIQPS